MEVDGVQFSLEASLDDPESEATLNADNTAAIAAAFGEVWPPPDAPAALEIALIGGTVTAGMCANGNATCARALISTEYACSSQL